MLSRGLAIPSKAVSRFMSKAADIGMPLVECVDGGGQGFGRLCRLSEPD